MKLLSRQLPALFTALVSAIGSLHAQTPVLSGYYVTPVRVEPLSLSGSTGEFRAAHFHTGLDFRVGGVSGAPVYAAAEGYISRITVSVGGYGNCLLVSHPNGTISLYGHLDAFSPKVAAYVEQEQYRRESFQVSLDCPPEMFPVQKGEQIGKAGNTGDSGGPHLHFEIRYQDSLYDNGMVTANLLNHGVYKLEDALPPEFRMVLFYGYSTSDDGIPVTRLITGFDGNNKQAAVNVPDTFFVAIDAIDRMNNTNFRLGVQTWEVYLDQDLVYQFSNLDLPLSWTRHILSLIHYPERSRNGRSLLKTWVEPGNVLKDRTYAPTLGLFTLSDTLTHSLRIVVHDAAGHSTRRTYAIRKNSGLEALTDRQENVVNTPTDGLPAEEYQQHFYWDRENSFAARDIRITVPSKALYSDMLFQASRLGMLEWQLHTPDIPLHLPMQVELRIPDTIPAALHDKVVVMRLQDNGRDPHRQAADPNLWRSAGGESTDSLVTFRTNSFGRFRMDVDTIPPAVIASFSRGADLRGRSSVNFTIKDACSGIGDYKVTIDGKWIPGVHDPKRSRITCMLEPERITRGVRHQVVMQVTDQKNNITTYKTEFLW